MFSAGAPIATDHQVLVYAIYLSVSIGLTVWLARTLYRSGETFLDDVFDENPALAQAFNRLLVVGFYMLNLGFSFLILRAETTPTIERAIELIVNRLGLLLMSLGIIHFINMMVFWAIRQHHKMAQTPPTPNLPIPPAAPYWTGA